MSRGMEIRIDGVPYAPVDAEEAARLKERLETFTLETRFGMYEEGDEQAPFFTEAFLYNLIGKDEARSVLGIVRGLAKLAGVESLGSCQHERLHQVSEAVLRTRWIRQDDGSYEPDADYRVLSETTGTFSCVDCETVVVLDGEMKIGSDE